MMEHSNNTYLALRPASIGLNVFRTEAGYKTQFTGFEYIDGIRCKCNIFFCYIPKSKLLEPKK